MGHTRGIIDKGSKEGGTVARIDTVKGCVYPTRKATKKGKERKLL